MSAFGQGISVTQTQMFRAFTAIANDGVMLEPKFISALYDPNDQTVRKSQREIVGNPVSKEAASLTRENMILVGTDPIYGTMYNRNDNKPELLFLVRMFLSNLEQLKLPMSKTEDI